MADNKKIINVQTKTKEADIQKKKSKIQWQKIKSKLKEYVKRPGSLVMFILIMLATLITVASMAYLVIYILSLIHI